jgi:hypothetical protein
MHANVADAVPAPQEEYRDLGEDVRGGPLL